MPGHFPGYVHADTFDIRKTASWFYLDNKQSIDVGTGVIRAIERCSAVRFADLDRVNIYGVAAEESVLHAVTLVQGQLDGQRVSGLHRGNIANFI